MAWANGVEIDFWFPDASWEAVERMEKYFKDFQFACVPCIGDAIDFAQYDDDGEELCDGRYKVIKREFQREGILLTCEFLESECDQ